MAGLPKSYIKKYGISKKAWKEYRKANKSRTTKVSTTKKSTRKRRGNPTPRNKNSRRRRGKRRIPILPMLGGFVAPMVDAFSKVGGTTRLQNDPEGFAKGMIDQIGLKYTGVHFLPEEAGLPEGKLKFEWQEPLKTYLGLMLGVMGSKIATKVGVNRQIARIPVVGDYIKL